MRRFVLGWKMFGLERSLGTRLITYADDLKPARDHGQAEADGERGEDADLQSAGRRVVAEPLRLCPFCTGSRYILTNYIQGVHSKFIHFLTFVYSLNLV